MFRHVAIENKLKMQGTLIFAQLIYTYLSMEQFKIGFQLKGRWLQIIILCENTNLNTEHRHTIGIGKCTNFKILSNKFTALAYLARKEERMGIVNGMVSGRLVK